MRWAKYFNVPISKGSPPGFPINTLPIQRALASLSISHPQSVESAISLFYENTWVQWGEPLKPQNMLAILRTILGSDEEAKKVLERTKTDEVKKTLSQNTDQAFKDGAFGLPYFVGEFFNYFKVLWRVAMRNTDDYPQLRTRRVRRKDSGESTILDNLPIISGLIGQVEGAGRHFCEPIS